MKYAQKGFTLIELFIVIAIIAILVAAASPKYAEYAARVEAAEKQEQRIANCKENPTEGQTLEECVAS